MLQTLLQDLRDGWLHTGHRELCVSPAQSLVQAGLPKAPALISGRLHGPGIEPPRHFAQRRVAAAVDPQVHNQEFLATGRFRQPGDQGAQKLAVLFGERRQAKVGNRLRNNAERRRVFIGLRHRQHIPHPVAVLRLVCRLHIDPLVPTVSRRHLPPLVGVGQIPDRRTHVGKQGPPGLLPGVAGIHRVGLAVGCFHLRAGGHGRRTERRAPGSASEVRQLHRARVVVQLKIHQGAKGRQGRPDRQELALLVRQ